MYSAHHQEFCLTKFEVFLRSGQKLSNSRRELFAIDRVAGAEEVLANEKGEDIDKMRVERDFLERQVIN